MYRVKKRINRRLTKSRTRRLNRSKSKSLNKSIKRNRRLNRSKSRNRRVRRRLKRSKNKRRNRKPHRGGFVEFGAALPCLPANSSDNSIEESIKNFNPDLLNSGNIKVIKARIKKEGAAKWSKEGELENDYGAAACMDKPRGIGKNACAYDESGKCNPNIDYDSLDKDLRKSVKDKNMTDKEIEAEFIKRGMTKSDRTNSAGKNLWDGPTSEVDASKKAEAQKLRDYRKQYTARKEYLSKPTDQTTGKRFGPEVTIEASLKQWWDSGKG